MGIIPVVLIAIAVAMIAGALSYHKSMRQSLPPSYNIARAEVDGLLRSTRNACLVLGTGSMQPAIRTGGEREVVAVVIYAVRDFQLLSQGDLVLFDRAGQLIVHQLAQLDKSGWITSGSANDGYDCGRVTRANFRGKVTAIYNITP